MAHIHLNNATLDLPIYDVQGRSLKKRLASLRNRGAEAEKNSDVVVLRALNDLTLQITTGDRIGLVGHNGAGKSTLLRVLAGIYSPTSGTIETRGKTVPLLDISLGMDENSTGWQNIRLRGLLLGMSDSEIARKQEEIGHFSELGDFLNLPIRTYSTGMRVRLGFAISTAVDADILLLDEVMGVGDAAFKDKANKRLLELHERSEIVVLALHDNGTIRKTCDKAIWLEKGSVREFGPVEDVLQAYEATTA
ncbi:ABC transporter ATP-binding protein [Paraburkholderia bryophila]|uniref:ABC-2 type transport system ATP-binding protein/lipopolysaccharide transport system ATP-binding protein n=1 Tax=Paraburkholderia bryophila TaxID=420952 RepID=A0A329BVJ1_9BURK|nr:ABC transporter ATP-binding protein [Paraburkholderia bryophila]RAS23144.1 ABC-2 type transport system ATP-binding protein/lipopolysaccharide transport system ATP-binding protein [Paraburkholderia bryophila]